MDTLGATASASLTSVFTHADGGASHHEEHHAIMNRDNLGKTKSYLNPDTDRFENPFDTWTQLPSMLKFVPFATSTWKRGWSADASTAGFRTHPLSAEEVDIFHQMPATGVRVTWIGHASTLVQFEGVNVLTDPVWQQRASPSQWIGPKRLVQPPLSIDQLPRIDAIVISHNHHDHLQPADLEAIQARFPDVRVYCPLRVSEYIPKLKNVIEMDWWEEAALHGAEHVRVCCTPAQHWSKWIFDDFKSLWSGFALIGENSRVYFAGDTGYCSAFKEIGAHFGPFDVALIPIGAYEPRELLRNQHVDPAEAVQVMEDLSAAEAVAIHWGTFVLTPEPIDEPPQLLRMAMIERDLDVERFKVFEHGQSGMFGIE